MYFWNMFLKNNYMKTQVIDDGKNILHVLAWIMICILSPGTCLLYAWHSGATTLTWLFTSCFHAMPFFFKWRFAFVAGFSNVFAWSVHKDVLCEFIWIMFWHCISHTFWHLNNRLKICRYFVYYRSLRTSFSKFGAICVRSENCVLLGSYR